MTANPCQPMSSTSWHLTPSGRLLQPTQDNSQHSSQGWSSERRHSVTAYSGRRLYNFSLNTKNAQRPHTKSPDQESPQDPVVEERSHEKTSPMADRKSWPRRKYSLSSKAPPAVTQDSLQEYGLAPERTGVTDRSSSAGFSGREDYVYEKNDSLQRRDFGKFVQFFRMSSSYIAGHRSNLFVVCLPGEIVEDKRLMQAILEDVAILNSLGVKLVLAAGTQHQVDTHLTAEGRDPQYVGGYRVTSEYAMKVAMQAAGAARTTVESQLSKALAVPMIRRHSRTAEEEHHYGPAVGVVSGNYVTGRRRGTVDGIDFGGTGSVRFVQVDAIKQQLDSGNVVLLTNLAYSAAGEVLSCNIYDVATHAAIEMEADKLICMTLKEVMALGLPQWLPLTDAEDMIATHLAAEVDAQAEDEQIEGDLCRVPGSGHLNGFNGNGKVPAPELELDLDCWQALKFPNAVVSAVVACKNGIKRTHIVDARIDGGLLLELYSRDGVGTMISTDFYEGIRGARAEDLDNITELLEPLVADGTVRRRSKEEVLESLHLFTVVEREARVLACVLVQPLGQSGDNTQCGELAAFCVHPSYRGSGRGDSLLDYVEQDARLKGIRRLVLLTTRTADWFEQRDFVLDDYAHRSKLIPESRRAKIKPERGSKLYYKALHDLCEVTQAAPAGKRIGF